VTGVEMPRGSLNLNQGGSCLETEKLEVERISLLLPGCVKMGESHEYKLRQRNPFSISRYLYYQVRPSSATSGGLMTRPTPPFHRAVAFHVHNLGSPHRPFSRLSLAFQSGFS
jgi:hypothetical protein